MLSTFDQIRESLLNGEMEQALQTLAEQQPVRANPKYRNEVLLQASKIRGLNETRRLGSVGDSQLNQEENRIRLAVLELIDLVESHSLNKYVNDEIDVFISYRREDGSQLARLISAELLRRNKKTFLDVENLSSGSWNDSILQSIARSRSFVLILSPGALDRIHEEDDVLRREITHALSLGKNIIPIMLPKFSMPANTKLPIALSTLPMQHGLTYSHEYFAAMIDKLISYVG